MPPSKADRSGPRRPGSTTGPPTTWSPTSHEQREATGVAAQRPHARGRAVPRRARRLAAGPPLPLRHAGARARGRWRSTPGCASATASTARRWPPTTASCIRIPDTDAEPPGGELFVFEPDEIEQTRHRTRSAARRCSPPGSASARPARCCCRAATRAGARRCGSSASARAQLLEVAAQVPVVPDRPRGGPRVPPGRLRPAGAASTLMRARRAPRGPRRRGRDHASRRRSPAPCCSATSPRSSTRATPRSPSAGPPRSRSTRACSPSCSAGPSCASCSTPRSLAEVEAELQRLAPDRRARDAEGVADLLRLLGPLTTEEVAGALRRRRRRRRLAGRARRRAPRRSQVRMAGERALGRRRGRRPAARRARRARARRAPPTRSPSRSTTRSATWSPATPAPTARSPPPTSPPGSASAPPSSGTTLQRLAAAGPGARGRVPARPAPAREWCDAEVLRRLRRRSLAAAAPGGRAGRARGARPVPARLAARRRRRGCAASTASLAVDRAARRRARCPPRRWSRWSCRPACRDYEPAMLDELTATGEVLWAGHGALPGTDGWVVAAPRRPGAADAARRPTTVEHSTSCTRRVLDALGARRRLLLPPARRRRSARPTTRRSSPRSGTSSGPGRVSNDTLAPLRALTRRRAAAHRTGARRHAPGPALTAAAARRGRLPAARRPARRSAGRWSLLPERDTDPTRRAHAAAERAARAPRRRHPRRRGQRAGAGRLRRRLQGARRLRGVRPLPPRLLRRAASAPPSSARAGAVDRLRTFAERAPTTPSRSARRARRDRPGQPLRRRPAVARPARATDGETPGTAPAARPARSSSSSTAPSRSTSSAAARPC